MKKYFSYSEMRCYLDDKDEYYRRYIVGEEFVPNDAMKIGSLVHKAIEQPTYNWIPDTKDVKVDRMKIRKILDKMHDKQPAESEVSMVAVKDDIKLWSIFDGFDKVNRELDEYKVSSGSYWNQRTVDSDNQLSFYAYVYWLNYHRFLKEIRLHKLNPKTGTTKTFYTVRSKADINEIEQLILLTINRIKQDGLWHKRLSRQERNNLKLL